MLKKIGEYVGSALLAIVGLLVGSYWMWDTIRDMFETPWWVYAFFPALFLAIGACTWCYGWISKWFARTRTQQPVSRYYDPNESSDSSP